MEPEKKTNGALVGLAIILIILIIGGIYVWVSNKDKVQTPATQSEPVTNQDAAALNTLEQEVTTIDTGIGVDTDSVK